MVIHLTTLPITLCWSAASVVGPAGIGFGLMYLPSIAMVSYYFDKRRALATGLAVCGSGVGTFVFAPFFDFLVAEYGWKVSHNSPSDDTIRYDTIQYIDGRSKLTRGPA